LNEGDKVKVKLTGTDPKTGKFKLSRKVLLPKPEGQREERRDGAQQQRGERPRFEKRGNGQEHSSQEASEEQGEQ